MAVTSILEYGYVSEAGKRYPIRISDKSKAVQTPAPTKGSYDDGNVKVSVSKHGQKRRTGIQARGVVIGLPNVDETLGYDEKTFVPILAKAQYDAIVKGANFTYDGNTWKVLDKVAEV